MRSSIFFFFSSNVSQKKVGRLHGPPVGFALHDYYPFAFAKEKKMWVAGDIRSEHTSTEQVLDRDPSLCCCLKVLLKNVENVWALVCCWRREVIFNAFHCWHEHSFIILVLLHLFFNTLSNQVAGGHDISFLERLLVNSSILEVPQTYILVVGDTARTAARTQA